MSEDILSKIVESVAELKLDESVNLVKEALDKGISALRIVTDGLSPGLREVGKRFEEYKYFLADLVFSAHIMNTCMNILEPLLVKESAKREATGKVVIGTVEGDLHDIGKNLVVVLLKASGFEVRDLGIDVSAEKFVNAVKEFKPDILGMSSLLTTTAPYMEVVVNELKQKGLRDGLYILIGGPPTSQNFAEQIDADRWCKDAIVGVNVAKKYMELKREFIESYPDSWWAKAREKMKEVIPIS